VIVRHNFDKATYSTSLCYFVTAVVSSCQLTNVHLETFCSNCLTFQENRYLIERKDLNKSFFLEQELLKEFVDSAIKQNLFDCSLHNTYLRQQLLLNKS